MLAPHRPSAIELNSQWKPVLSILDTTTLVKCTQLNISFKEMVRKTLNERYQGRDLTKLPMLASLDTTNNFLYEDLKASSSPEFMKGWNKYTERLQNMPRERMAKILLINPRHIGARSFRRVGLHTEELYDFNMKYMDYEGNPYMIQYWNKAYVRHFDVPNTYFGNANVVILMYDTSDPKCMDSMKNWLAIFDTLRKDKLFLFVGTKADQRKVSKEQMEEHIKTLLAKPKLYTQFGVENSSETFRYPYVLETRMDDEESCERVFRLAAYMALRFKKNKLSVPPVPGKSRVIPFFKNLLAGNK